jgi:hypothetical protein
MCVNNTSLQAGRFVGDVPVLVRARMRNAKDDGIGVNMEVRNEHTCVSVVVVAFSSSL